MSPSEAPAPGAVPFSEALRVWLRVALLSFGGPAGQIAVMHRIVVEERHWIGEARFLHALNYCMLLPGPEAQQLATYIGWLMHRTRGGLTAGVLFVIPGIISIMALSIVYAAFGQLGVVSALFFGLKTAVLAIVLGAARRIGGKALKNGVLATIAGLAFIGIFAFDVPFPALILAAGLLGFVGGRAGWSAFVVDSGHGVPAKAAVLDSMLDAGRCDHVRPDRGWSIRVAAIWLVLWLAPVAGLYLGLGPDNVFTQIGVFFAKMAVVTFGGAYAVLAYVAQEAVTHYHWLSQGEMLDGLGMAETTPGPLIMVLQFVGFLAAWRDPGALSPLAAGVLGGLLATWVTFTPCFLWIFLGAPYVEQLRGNRALAAALAAITAAVVGVIANLALWFALHTVFRQTERVSALGGLVAFDLPLPASLDPWSLVLSLAAVVAIFRFRAGMAPILVGCSGAGMVLHLLGLVP